VFKFGGWTRLKSDGEYELPVCMVGKQVRVKTDVVESDIPLLLSRSAMKKAGVKMDLENDTAVIMGKEGISSELSSSYSSLQPPTSFNNTTRHFFGGCANCRWSFNKADFCSS
jgi:hypothetical protein